MRIVFLVGSNYDHFLGSLARGFRKVGVQPIVVDRNARLEQKVASMVPQASTKRGGSNAPLLVFFRDVARWSVFVLKRLGDLQRRFSTKLRTDGWTSFISVLARLFVKKALHGARVNLVIFSPSLSIPNAVLCVGSRILGIPLILQYDSRDSLSHLTDLVSEKINLQVTESGPGEENRNPSRQLSRVFQKCARSIVCPKRSAAFALENSWPVESIGFPILDDFNEKGERETAFSEIPRGLVLHCPSDAPPYNLLRLKELVEGSASKEKKLRLTICGGNQDSCGRQGRDGFSILVGPMGDSSVSFPAIHCAAEHGVPLVQIVDANENTEQLGPIWITGWAAFEVEMEKMRDGGATVFGELNPREYILANWSAEKIARRYLVLLRSGPSPSSSILS